MNIFSYVLTVLAGSANPLQSGASSQLNKTLASPLWAALVVYASGLFGVVIVQLFVRQAWPSMKLGDVPWWGWTGGILSIASTITGLTMAQKMGSGLFTGLNLTASLVTSIVLDQYGLMGFKQHSLSPMRAVGSVLMIVGIWLIAKF